MIVAVLDATTLVPLGIVYSLSRKGGLFLNDCPDFPMSVDLFEPIKTMSKITDEVIVGFSCGKDSIVTLDLASRYFKKIHAYFMYIVPNLSFQEKVLKKYENKYNIEIERLPHPDLSCFLRYGTYRVRDSAVREIRFPDIADYLRSTTGIKWIMGGERLRDSIVRRAMLKHGGSINRESYRMYPLINWNKHEVVEYIKRKRLYISKDFGELGHSFCSLQSDDLIFVKNNYPEDYERIKKFFPLCEVSVRREEIYNSK